MARPLRKFFCGFPKNCYLFCVVEFAAYVHNCCSCLLVYNIHINIITTIKGWLTKQICYINLENHLFNMKWSATHQSMSVIFVSSVPGDDSFCQTPRPISGGALSGVKWEMLELFHEIPCT